jgi:hypothetical protein
MARCLDIPRKIKSLLCLSSVRGAAVGLRLLFGADGGGFCFIFLYDDSRIFSTRSLLGRRGKK